MHRLVFLIVILFSPFLSAQEQSFEPLYHRIADDIKAGKPLIVVSHYGMWAVRNDQPERNLNWGVYYGHATMMKRAKKDRHIKKLYTHHKFKSVFATSQDSDPMRTLVFKTTVKPNKRWRKKGVEKPFDLYVVMKAYQDQEQAAVDSTQLSRGQNSETFVTDEGVELNTKDAQVTGYFGHNFFYDYEDFSWPGLADVSGEIAKPMGLFSVGCNTARVPGFDAWFETNAVPLLFSRSLMASEGYSTLALLDGLARHMNGVEMVKFADKTYAYFQKLGKPKRRVGKPFVSVEYRFK